MSLAKQDRDGAAGLDATPRHTRLGARVDAMIAKTLPLNLATRTATIFLPLALAAMLVFYLLYATQSATTLQLIAADQKQLVEVGRETLRATLATIDNDTRFMSDASVLRQWLDDPSAQNKQVLAIVAQILARPMTAGEAET